MLDMNKVVGTHHILFVTLDTLRFDVAERAFQAGQIPGMAKWLPAGWERRHSPANFTYAAHHAFFAGFLPTPITIESQPRLFATSFPGSETTSEQTCVFSEANIVHGLVGRGYETHCIGGVGFFNKRTSLGCVLPDLFQYSYWSDSLGVTCRESTTNQVDIAMKIISVAASEQLLFMFINISAIHQPNCMYLPGADADSPQSQQAALQYVDAATQPLWGLLELTAPWFVVLCSDHGTAYGEDGRTGHRFNHPVIGDVPYAEFTV